MSATTASLPYIANSATVPEEAEFVRYLAEQPNHKSVLKRVEMSAMSLKDGSAIDAEIGDRNKPVGRLASELVLAVPEEPDWLIPGLAAKGWMVKLAAREKIGKGTLMFYLLGCLERQEASVFGPAPSAAISSLIYTEEPQDSVREKAASFNLQRSRIIFGYELGHLSDWPSKVAYLVSVAVSEGHGAIFVDNISRAAGAEDEAGVELARAAEALGEAAKPHGITVFVDHHHKKGAGKLSDKSRGGTALAGACDNNIELERIGQWDSRIRRVSARGRLSSTIWQRQIALTDDGSAYEPVADSDQPQAAQDRHRLGALAEFEDGATASEFAARFELSDTTARRVLERFTEAGWATPDEGHPRRWRATGKGLGDNLSGGLAL